MTWGVPSVVLSQPAVNVRVMRLLHTSDWHIGKSLHGADLLADQERVLTGLADLIRAESIDVVLVSGDIYDRAMPPAAATAVLDRVLTELRAAGAQLIITPGNHDSSIRLNYAAGLLSANGVHLRTSVTRLDEPVLIEDEHGPVGFYAIPYLEPDLVRCELGVGPGKGHAGVLAAAMDRIRADQHRRGLTRAVVLAHAFVAGGARGDSERDISVGGVEVVAAEVFDGVSYVALGHLHRSQEITREIHYAGSPLAYSFTEAEQVKSVKVVDLDASGLADVTVRELVRCRGMATLTGTLAELLADPALQVHVPDYVSARLVDAVRPVDAMRRLRERFGYCVHLDWVPSGVEAPPDLTYAERIVGRSDLAIAGDFVTHVRNVVASPAEIALLADAFAAGRVAETAS